MAVKENTSANKESDMDKSSTVCSSASDRSVVASQDQIEEGYVDFGELNPSPWGRHMVYMTGAIR